MSAMHTGATTVAERVRELREAKGMGQSELARRSGLGRHTVIRIERGTTSPYLETLSRLAQALDVSVTEFLSDEEM